MKIPVFLSLLLFAECVSGQVAKGDSSYSSSNITEPKMQRVDGGSFTMGSNDGPQNGQPAHIIRLETFYIGVYEVTQSLWQAVMGYNHSQFKCNDCPVEQVSPKQIRAFIKKLNQHTGKHYRLPTEAEWEYAASGGNKSLGYKYSGSNRLDDVAWFVANAENKTHPVGQKKPNELGLYDMSGNVWEICGDWYRASFYKNSSAFNPQNNKRAFFKVVRGGSWRSPEERCYNKARNRNIHDHHRGNGGFRLVLGI